MPHYHITLNDCCWMKTYDMMATSPEAALEAAFKSCIPHHEFDRNSSVIVAHPKTNEILCAEHRTIRAEPVRAL